MSQQSFVDFNSFNPKTSRGEGNIVFIKRSNTQAPGLTVRPFGRIFVQRDVVFDPQIKRSRKARGDERGKTQYLFNGVDAEGKVKTYVAGAQVIAGIKDVREIVDREDIYVDITSSGTGLNTEYLVRPNKRLDGRINESTLKVPDLEAVAAILVVAADNPETDETAVGVSATNVPWGAGE